MHHHDIIKFNVGWGIHDHCLKMRGHQRPAPGVRITRAVIAGMLLAFVACVATSQYLAKGIANRLVSPTFPPAPDIFSASFRPSRCRAFMHVSCPTRPRWVWCGVQVTRRRGPQERSPTSSIGIPLGLRADVAICRAVVLSGNIGSDSEYENEHDVSAAIHMGFQSNHTEQFTYVNEFNETLGSISANIEEAQGAVGEAKDLDSTYKRYYQGTDPW